MMMMVAAVKRHCTISDGSALQRQEWRRRGNVGGMNRDVPVTDTDSLHALMTPTK